ncbi:MAG: glycosyltransferase [Gammaproteobacteria bacterium]|nr:glycosyltransferase [Gammaproteobacteria bacterium]
MNQAPEGKEAANNKTGKRRRVLFIAEAVSLAHVARPAVLAQALDPEQYTVCLACDPRFDALFTELPFERRSIYSISTQSFLAALAKGSPIYTTSTLRRYVRDDLELLRAWSPDLVVGDFRLSLAVSARAAGIPYLTITNAYWSPYARQRYPIPEHVMARLVGVDLAQALFRLVRPLIFAAHTIPMNRVRKEWGQPLLGTDLRRVYTDADHTLYADVPGFIETAGMPDDHHHFLGPVLWSPPQAFPDWWNEVRNDRPIIYVTPGSSGDSRLLTNVLQALAGLPVEVMVATAGQSSAAPVPANVHSADYLPGMQAAARADLVICNGGSPTTQQALAAGTPVLGICSNLDQYLNMQAVATTGAGMMLRAGKASVGAVRAAVERLLADPSCQEAAQRMADRYRVYDANQRFSSIVEQLLPVTGGTAATGGELA